MHSGWGMVSRGRNGFRDAKSTTVTSCIASDLLLSMSAGNLHCLFVIEPASGQACLICSQACNNFAAGLASSNN